MASTADTATSTASGYLTLMTSFEDHATAASSCAGIGGVLASPEDWSDCAQTQTFHGMCV